MTRYSYVVIYNPISTWILPADYSKGDKVEDLGIFYESNTDHTSTGGNRPPGAFWDIIVPTSPNTDITDFVEVLNDTDIGSGQIRSLELRLNANRGQFITNTQGGLTPIIDEFDKIKIAITDRDKVTYSATHEVIIIKPTQDSVQGVVLPIELMGSELHLMRTLFAEQFFFKSMFTTSKGIVDFYNKNKGILQTTVIDHDNSFADNGGNDLKKWTATDYLFNLNETTHYDGLINVMDRGGSSVASGGAGDFFEIVFESDARPERIKFRGFSSGNPPDQPFPIPNIIDTTTVNPGEEEGGIEATKGTVIGTWCADGVGILPRQNAVFIGALEAWPLFPSHVSGELYPSGAIILVPNTIDSQGDFFHYKTNKDTSIAPPIPPISSNADWDQYFFVNFLINENNYNLGGYSFWTDFKPGPWKSNGANTGGNIQEDPPTANSLSVWDSNLVVVDGKFSRTWVDVRALNEAAIPGKFKRAGQVYRGFRVLVDGTGTAEFAGFDNFIIQWSGIEWLIFKRSVDDQLAAVDDESRVYQFRGPPTTTPPQWVSLTTYQNKDQVQNDGRDYECIQTHSSNPTREPGVGIDWEDFWIQIPTWVDISTSLDQGNDCYHPVYDITSVQGLNNKDNGGGGNFGQKSAIQYEFRYEKSDAGPFSLNTPTAYRIFAGANFRVPFPFNADNSNTIGRFYGDNDSREPATFEAANMNLTSSGFSGFNNEEAEDLGAFDALSFAINHEWRYNKDGSGNTVFAGNFAYRCVIYGIDDGVVKKDFVVPFNGLWEPVSLGVTEFEAYEARAPWAFGNIGQNILLQEIEVLKKIRWRNIKKIAIHWLGPYDDEGRYKPQFNLDVISPSLLDFFTGLFISGFNIKLKIDAFGWSKAGLSVSPPDTNRSLMPVFFEEPLISNKFQNDQANLAKLEILKFRHKQYEVTTEGRNNLRFGDSFFLENKFLVKESDRTIDDIASWVTATDYFLNDDVKIGGVIYRCVKDHSSSGANQPPDVEFWKPLQNPIPNTIKLVAKKIVRSIDKLPDGSVSGFLRPLTGVKRFDG